MVDADSKDFDLPNAGRLCGVDFGTVRIGLATCDPSQQFVSPLETYVRQDARREEIYFQELVDSQSLVGWVFGLPVHCDGQESQKSAEVRKFAQWLNHLTALPYAFYDERFSSKEARGLMLDTGWSPQKKKKNVDRLAAYLILGHFLENRKNSVQPPGPLG